MDLQQVKAGQRDYRVINYMREPPVNTYFIMLFIFLKKGGIISMKKIAVMGSGGWGTAIAMSAVLSENDVTVWSAFPEEISRIVKSGENPLLPGIKMPKELKFTSDIADVTDADIIVTAVPSFATADIVDRLAGAKIPESTIIVNISKGFDPKTCNRLSVTIQEALPKNRVAVLSGPSHAEEVARGVPTALVAASTDKETALIVQRRFTTPRLRVYTNGDIVGVELGGAIKNVIALAAGITDGLKLGDNTKAALMTRGLSEIGRLGKAMGGNEKTFAGLTGVGDLIVTCTSMHSRNRRAGMLIGEGVPVDEVIKIVGTVEGYHAAKLAHNLKGRYNVDMPIMDACYKICYEGGNPLEEAASLMTRPTRHEDDDTWLN